MQETDCACDGVSRGSGAEELLSGFFPCPPGHCPLSWMCPRTPTTRPYLTERPTACGLTDHRIPTVTDWGTLTFLFLIPKTTVSGWTTGTAVRAGSCQARRSRARAMSW